MAAQIGVGEADDPRFIELLNSVLREVIESSKPEQVWLIQIDNWFDHRWLNFSGIGVVDFPLPALGIGENGALDEFSQEERTFPPFTPSRVLGQWSYVREGDHYSEAPLAKLPHPSKRQRSERNLQRRVQDFAESGAFIWYSTNTVANGRGSLMVYTVEKRKVDSWFASFVRNEDWKMHSTKGVSRAVLQQFLNRSS
jgi:hypothetical protein